MKKGANPKVSCISRETSSHEGAFDVNHDTFRYLLKQIGLDAEVIRQHLVYVFLKKSVSLCNYPFCLKQRRFPKSAEERALKEEVRNVFDLFLFSDLCLYMLADMELFDDFTCKIHQHQHIKRIVLMHQIP